jgi:hypothetical protein
MRHMCANPTATGAMLKALLWSPGQVLPAVGLQTGLTFTAVQTKQLLQAAPPGYCST